MSENGNPVRSWREIADEASRERDPGKLQQLATELELAFDVRDEERKPQPIPLRRQQSA